MDSSQVPNVIILHKEGGSNCTVNGKDEMTVSVFLLV